MRAGLLRGAGVLALAAALLVAAGVTLGASPDPAPAAAVSAAPVDVAAVAPEADLGATIAALQARLERLPDDWQARAALGTAYVQQAGVTGDPSLYARAETALRDSLAQHPDGNDGALTGQAALAAARHEFVAARELADQALAVNSYSAAAHGVRTDALVELGSYDEAFASLQRMLDLRPGVPSYARASYSFELRGDLESARAALEQVLRVAVQPADAAFAHRYLGELAFGAGDLVEAGRQFDEGLRRSPGAAPLLAGRARVLAAGGEHDAAVEAFSASVRRLPDPAVLTEFGELLDALGRDRQAQEQYAVVRATQQLQRAAGVDLDLDQVLFLVDHGDAGQALRAARTAWQTRRSVQAADAYAWALHANGRHAEALELARQSQRLGIRSALFDHHRGMIERALGMDDAARASLTSALETNPHFSSLHAPRARATLAELSEG